MFILQRRNPLILMLTVLSLLGAAIAQAQGVCPTPVVPPSETVCEGLGADQICYIGGEITPFAREGVENPAFSTPGDKLDINTLEAVELQGDATILIHLSANMSEGQFLSGTAFGDLRIEFPSSPVVNLPLTANTNANLRGGAGTGFNTVGSLTANTTITALGRNEAGDWYFVQADEETTGWVFADLVAIEGDPDTLTILADDATEAPGGLAMLNLYPLSASDNCITNALVLGSPEGTGKAHLIVNNVQLEIGSILSLLMNFSKNYFAQQAEGLIAELQSGLPPSAELVMRVQTLQGLIRATAFVGSISGEGIIQALNEALEAAYNPLSIPGGIESIVVLDKDLVPVTQPIALPYQNDLVQNLVDTMSPTFNIIAWGGGGVTPTSAPTLEEFNALKDTPPEAQPLVGTWQLVDVDPNATVTSGTTSSGVSGGCTSYAPVGTLLQPMEVTSTEEGLIIPSSREPIPFDDVFGIYSLTIPQENGDYTAISVQGDGTTLTVTTDKYEKDSYCSYDEGDLLTTYTYTYERADDGGVVPTSVPLDELKENLSGVWEYVGSEQETLICTSGQEINLRKFAGDELTLVFSEKFENVASVVYSDAIPQRVGFLNDESGGIYLGTSFYYPETLEINGEVVDMAALGAGSQIRVEQWIPGSIEGDTLVVSEVYNLLMAFDFSITDDFRVESKTLDCPDVIRNTHTYQRVSSEVPEETANYINLLAESTEKWVFDSAEPREVQCNDVTIDPVFDLVKLQVEPLVDGAKLWFSVPRFNRNSGWIIRDFVYMSYETDANVLLAEISEGVTLSVTGRNEDSRLQLVKESTVAGCEYSAEIVMRPLNSPIPETSTAPTEVVESLIGSWQMSSQEPAVDCGTRGDAFAYNFSNLQVQPGQYGEPGLALSYNKVVYYDPQLNIFRGQDEDTGGIITIPAEVAGNTLVMTISGVLNSTHSNADGTGIVGCETPEDTVITVTYKRN